MKKKPGPKSIAELSVVSIDSKPRVKAPTGLPASQAERIATLIASKPADWFQAADMPLLVELARHLDRADKIDEEMQDLEPGDLKGLKWLQPLANAESARIQSLMRSLRLTPQSRYRADSVKANTPPAGPRIWDPKP